ncbi:MAG: hypothetical protein QXR84_09785 [Candidatus Bathyarchaeia archaeon]
MKSLSALTLTVLIALITISTLAVKQTAASNLPNNPENKADDTLYLRRDTYNNLTTAAPTNETAATIIINGGSSTTRIWVNETAVPNGYSWTINPGTYNFTFWISRNHQNINVTNVAFKFGYINAAGQSTTIVEGEITGLTPTKDVKTMYNITVYKGDRVSISSGSKLFINVTISVSGPGGQSATFYYDGVDQKTQIITPSISAVVPEFPFGAVFLPPALLSAYFILKKRIVKLKIWLL